MHPSCVLAARLHLSCTMPGCIPAAPCSAAPQLYHARLHLSCTMPGCTPAAPCPAAPQLHHARLHPSCTTLVCTCHRRPAPGPDQAVGGHRFIALACRELHGIDGEICGIIRKERGSAESGLLAGRCYLLGVVCLLGGVACWEVLLAGRCCLLGMVCLLGGVACWEVLLAWRCCLLRGAVCLSGL